MTDSDSDTAQQISLGLDDWDLYFADHFDQIFIIVVIIIIIIITVIIIFIS